MTVPQFEGSEYSLPPPPRYRAGLFRLAGFGGALVMLRSGVDSDPPRLTLDIGFLTPVNYMWAIRRTMGAGLADELSRFFFSCASDLHPELSVAPVQDEASGVSVRVEASTDETVDIEFDVGAGDALNMQTTRVALTLAAMQVRALVQPNTSRYVDEDW